MAAAAGCGKQQNTAPVPPTPTSQATPPPQAADSTPDNLISDTNSPLYGWEKYSSAEGKFYALFPSRPKEETQTKQGSDGEVQGQSFTASEDSQNTYNVSYYDLPHLNDPKMMLARVEQFIVTGEKAKIESYKAMQVGGHYATEFEIVPANHPDFGGRIRLIAVGQRVYVLMAAYLTAQPHPEETDAFFNSFTLQG